MNAPENNVGEELLEAASRLEETNTSIGDTGRRFILKRWWSREEILAEQKLILNKESRLSAAQRKAVMSALVG